MYLIELSQYSIAPVGSSRGVENFYFALSGGDVCAIQTDSTDDAYVFLKALATLLPPEKGDYRFHNESVNFSDYRNLLHIKKKIGYIGQDSAMVSNKTLRENMLLMQCYFENSLTVELDENSKKHFQMFDLENKMDLRPGELRPVDLRWAIAVRELGKSFDVLLLERPEDYFGYERLEFFNGILNQILKAGHAVVFFSQNKGFVNAFANRKILITGGFLKEIPL